YTSTTTAKPPDPAGLQRVAGHGSSPIVSYEGTGIYFLDKVRPGVWRLEVYPDAVPIRDPFEAPNADKIVTRAIRRAWPMTVALPDLGPSFTVQPITAGNPQALHANGGSFSALPGVYVLNAGGSVELPDSLGHIGFKEYHAPPSDTVPPSVQSWGASQYVSGKDAEVRASIVDLIPPDSAKLFVARTDAARLTFTRIGDAGRRGLFRVAMSQETGQPVFHLELPVDSSGWSPPDYTASLVIKSRVLARQETINGARELRVRLRGLSAGQKVHVTLMEDDGTSWTSPLAADTTWQEQVVPLTKFTAGRGVLLPEGFPGEWNYWVGPAAGRGGTGDHPRLDHLERIQISLRPHEGRGVEVEWVTLGF